MVWGDWIAEWGRRDEPEHLRRGRLGERAARRQLSKAGLQLLTERPDQWPKLRGNLDGVAGI